MTETYSKKEIKELLQKHFNALSVGEALSGYDDEFYVTLPSKDSDFNTGVCKTVEVVSLKTAIKNEADFVNKDDMLDYYKNIVEVFVNGETLLEIGAYKRLADNLFYREY